MLERSFSQEEHDLANLLLPRGNIIDVAGDPDSVNLDLPDTNIQCEVLPQLEHAVGKPRGFKQIAAGLRRLAEWSSEVLPGYLPQFPPIRADEDADSLWPWERYCPQIKHKPGQSCVSSMCEGHDQEAHSLCCSGEGAIGYCCCVQTVWPSCWEPRVTGAL